MFRKTPLVIVVLLMFYPFGLFGQEKGKDPPPITIRVSPRVVIVSMKNEVYPNIIIIVEKHTNNRWLEITWGENGVSGRQLEGENSKRVWEDFSGKVALGPGQYEIKATVYRNDGKQFSAGETVEYHTP